MRNVGPSHLTKAFSSRMGPSPFHPHPAHKGPPHFQTVPLWWFFKDLFFCIFKYPIYTLSNHVRPPYH